MVPGVNESAQGFEFELAPSLAEVEPILLRQRSAGGCERVQHGRLHSPPIDIVAATFEVNLAAHLVEGDDGFLHVLAGPLDRANSAGTRSERPSRKMVSMEPLIAVEPRTESSPVRSDLLL